MSTGFFDAANRDTLVRDAVLLAPCCERCQKAAVGVRSVLVSMPMKLAIYCCGIP